jgi:hypothetical protein
MYHCDSRVGAGVEVNVGRGVSEGAAVGVPVAEGVGGTVAVSVGEGSWLAVCVGSIATVGEGLAMKVNPPHPINNRDAIDIQGSFFCKFSIADD